MKEMSVYSLDTGIGSGKVSLLLLSGVSMPFD